MQQRLLSPSCSAKEIHLRHPWHPSWKDHSQRAPPQTAPQWLEHMAAGVFSSPNMSCSHFAERLASVSASVTVTINCLSLWSASIIHTSGVASGKGEASPRKQLQRTKNSPHLRQQWVSKSKENLKCFKIFNILLKFSKIFKILKTSSNF